MKLIFKILLFCFILRQNASAQLVKDTIQYKAFEVIEEELPRAYKNTTFDSSAIDNAQNLAQLLSENSTVFIKTYGSGSLATVSFRGTGASHTKVQWNGVNLNSPMNGQIDFSLYPTFFFDDAALHYGASGLIDGNGALGGSVLINNTTSFNKGLSVNINQTIASFNSYISSAKAAYSNKKWFLETKLYHTTSDNNFEYINSAKANTPKETQINAQLQQYGISQAIYRKFKNSTLGTRIWYFNSNRQLPSTMLIDNNDENQIDKSFRTLIEWKGLSNNFEYKITSALIKNELIYANKIADIFSVNNSYLIDNNINTKLYLNKNFVVTNKLNVKYEYARADGFDEEHNRFNNSWLIGISKNYNRLSVDLFNRFIVVGEEVNPLAPSLGMRYQILANKLLYLKTNAGINYNYPTFNDLFWNPGGNRNLKPEQAKMIEAGLSYSKSNKKTLLKTELTAFYAIVKDWIIWQPTEFGFWSPSNLKEVENKGIEAVVSFNFNWGKILVNNNLSYAYTISTNRKAKNDIDNSVDKQLIYVPFNKLNYTLNAKYKTTTLSYNYNYTDKRFITTDNNWYLPANFLSNISLSNIFKTTKKTNIIITFKVNNIFNQAYQSIVWRAMPGRNYLVTLSFQFN